MHSNEAILFQVKHDFSLLRSSAIICGWFNITVNWDYLHAQNQGKIKFFKSKIYFNKHTYHIFIL